MKPTRKELEAANEKLRAELIQMSIRLEAVEKKLEVAKLCLISSRNDARTESMYHGNGGRV